ncbi:nucleotidyltransferase domain-containing protein [Peribacillus simplex]|uniref:nucleotidyltransferase domain-containing protein n=1 Tax=Peribacillus simplex TaxID=1478 RepID=UPI003D08B2CB
MKNNTCLEMDLISKELRLLLDILKTKEDSKLEKKSELFLNIDWELFLLLARHHRVYPLIYSKLKGIDEKLVPQHVVEALYQEYKKNTFQMLHLCGEIEKIGKKFTENNIPLLFLKGPVVAHYLYGDISLRTSRDLDILIPITNLEKAEKLLLSFGYERMDPEVLNKWNWRDHHITYFNPKIRTLIEIHWRLHPRPSKEPSFNELWERKRKSMLTSYPVYFLGEEDLFFFLSVHGSRHGWFRLRWLTDIDQMVRKGLCIGGNNRLLKKFQYNHIVGQAFILSSQLLYTQINEEMKKLTVRNLSKKLAQKSFTYINGVSEFNPPKDYMFLLNTTTQKFLFVVNLFIPRYQDVEVIRLPKLFHFLYFPLRPFLWAWRKTRKQI